MKKASTLQKKCDKCLTPLLKKKFPRCECCGRPTEVAHHWIEKSRSSLLRYDEENLIPLCHSCHAKIHNRFGNSVTGALDVAEIIINKRGRAWKEKLDKLAKCTHKVDVPYYEKILAKLNEEV